MGETQKYKIVGSSGIFSRLETPLTPVYGESIVEVFNNMIEVALSINDQSRRSYPTDFKGRLYTIQQITRPIRNKESVDEDSKISFVAADIDKIGEFLEGEELDSFLRYIQSDEFFSAFPDILFTERTRSGCRLIFGIDYTMEIFLDRLYTAYTTLATDLSHLHNILVRDRVIPHLKKKFVNFKVSAVDSAMESLDRAVIMWLHDYRVNTACVPYVYKTDVSAYHDCSDAVKAAYVDVVSANKFGGLTSSQISNLVTAVDELYERSGTEDVIDMGLVYPYTHYGEDFKMNYRGVNIAGASPRTKYLNVAWCAASCGVPSDTAFKLFMLVPTYNGPEHYDDTYNTIKSLYSSHASAADAKICTGSFVSFVRCLNVQADLSGGTTAKRIVSPEAIYRTVNRYLSEDIKFLSEAIIHGENRKFNILQAPTGTGKTTLSFSLVRELYEKSTTYPLCVIVEPYTNLVRAMGNKAKEEGLNVIMLSKDEDSPDFTKKFELPKYIAMSKVKPTIVVATYDSFYYQFIKGNLPVDLLIIDELHTVVKESNFRKIVLPGLFSWGVAKVSDNESKCIVLSLSATVPLELPVMLSTLDVPTELYIYDVENAVPVSFYLQTLSGQRKLTLASTICNILDTAKAQLKYVPPTIIHNNNKDENLAIELYLRNRNYRCESANSEKQEPIHGFQRGEFDILIATDVAVAGYDLKGENFDGKESIIMSASSFKNETLNPESVAQLAGRFRGASSIKIIRICKSIVNFLPIEEDDDSTEAVAYRDYTKLYEGNELAYVLSNLTKHLAASDMELAADTELYSDQRELYKDFYASDEYDSKDFSGISLYSGVNVSVVDEEVRIQIPQVVNSCLNKRNKAMRGPEFFKILSKYIKNLDVNLFSDPYDELYHTSEISPDFADFCKGILESKFSKTSSYDFLNVGLHYIESIAGLNPRHKDAFYSLSREFKLHDRVLLYDLFRCAEFDSAVGGIEAIVDNFLEYMRVVFIDYCNFVYNRIHSPHIPEITSAKQYEAMRKSFDLAFLALTKLNFVSSYKDFIFGEPSSELSLVTFTPSFNQYGRDMIRTFLSNNVVSPVQTLFSIDKDILHKLDSRFQFQIENPSKLPMFVKLLDKIRKRDDSSGTPVYSDKTSDTSWLSVFHKSFAFNIVNFIKSNTKLSGIDKLISWNDLSQSAYKTLKNAYKAMSLRYFPDSLNYVASGKSLVLNIKDLASYFGASWNKFTNLSMIKKLSDYIGRVLPDYALNKKDKEDKVFTYDVLGIEDLGIDFVLNNIQYFKKFFTI